MDENKPKGEDRKPPLTAGVFFKVPPKPPPLAIGKRHLKGLTEVIIAGIKCLPTSDEKGADYWYLCVPAAKPFGVPLMHGQWVKEIHLSESKPQEAEPSPRPSTSSPR